MRKLSESKRTQQEIIVTVLLVLIAIAAVALVATFVLKNVKQSSQGAQQRQECLKLDFEVTKANGGDMTVTIKRGGSSAIALNETKVYVDGSLVSTINPAPTPGDTKVITLTTALAKGQNVEVAGVLADGYVCQPSTEEAAA